MPTLVEPPNLLGLLVVPLRHKVDRTGPLAHVISVEDGGQIVVLRWQGCAYALFTEVLFDLFDPAVEKASA